MPPYGCCQLVLKDIEPGRNGRNRAGIGVDDE